MHGCRQTLGRRCVFDNHDLDTELPGPLHRIYATMKQLGPEIEFQTWRTTPKDFDGTIRLGVSHGASAIELSPGLWRVSAGGGRQAPAVGEACWKRTAGKEGRRDRI